MKKYLLLLAMVCLLANGTQAQNRASFSETVTEVMDFSGLSEGTNISYTANQNYITGAGSRSFVSQLEKVYYLSVGQDNTGNWRIGSSNGSTCLMANNNADLYIHNVKMGDIVTVWMVGNGQMASNNATISQGQNLSGQVTFQMRDNTIIENEGRIKLQIYGGSGISKIQIETTKPNFNYDPGYEVYDFYQIGAENSNAYDNNYSTTDDAGFSLKGNQAKYLSLASSAGLSLNDRIAVCQQSGWTFRRGIRAPGYNDGGNDWYNVSICNLKEGDRVEIFYTGDAPTISSNGQNGAYTGSAGYKDVKNDGVFDADEGDQMFSAGMPLEGLSCRNEGILSNEENTAVLLYRSFAYVMTEDGHLDLGLKNGNHTRILKVKIYSDHQATMIDEDIEDTRSTRAFFDITGELQAKEHIIPGGLEVRVGNENKDQHAIVVSSNYGEEIGQVSYVNAVDGFKLPGISKENNQIQINFDLGNNSTTGIPTTGTFYKFIPQVDGKMTVRFKAYSMNYYRYDLTGDAAYYDEEGWLTEFDRANEQTLDLSCPYYLKVSDENGISGAQAVWGGSSSGSGGGSEDGIELTKPTNSQALPISEILGHTSNTSDIITFYFNTNNYYDGLDIGYLQSSNNSNNTQYRFNTSNVSSNGDFQLNYTVQDLINIAGSNNDGIMANVYNATLSRVALTTLNGSPISSSSSSSSSSSTVPTSDNKSLGNGADGEFELHVEAGKVYYLYGGWDSNSNSNSYTISPRRDDKHACGVAELFDVTFTPDKDVHPLAKWVKSGTSSDEDLATIIGYTANELTVKKMSGNITGCEPYIDGDKLKIRNITFAEDKNPGGVILIKIGNPEVMSDPVYAFTVAYDADEDYDNELGEGVRGHVWDFSTKSLNGLTWDPKNNGKPTPNSSHIYENDLTSTSKYAATTDYGTYFVNYFNNDLNENKANGGSLLWQEMNYEEDGIARSDWMFNYRLQIGNENHDPRFLNKYDIEGDNADMMWDTEGLIFQTSSNQSCMFNEFIGTVQHTESNDPDRYIGILPGGSFRIPWLDKDDRVIIYMGSGEGNGLERMVFNITNARDALYKEITSTDEYIAGGSQWTNEGSNNNNYRGCYHFFATGDGNGGPADMIFEMTGGSMCKIYKIQIYRGKRIKTNDLVPDGDSPLFLVSKKDSEKTAEGTYSIQYLGKGESVDEPEMAGMTGNLANATYSLAALEDDKTSVHFTTTVKDKFGVFNMQLNDLERNNKYVADFADRNFPIGYYEELPQPYTWDFTDVNRFNTTYLASENTKYSADDLNIWDAEKNFTWKRDDTNDLLFAPGGQIYADAQMIAESVGMQFTPMNVGSGTIQPSADGLIIKTGIDDIYSEDAAARPVTGGAYGNNSDEKKSIWEIPWETSEYHPAPINYDSSIDEDPRIGWKLTIPNLPNLTTAYIRVQTIEDLKPKLTLDFARGYFNEAGQPVNDSYGDWNFFKKVIDNGDGTKDIILGLSPTNGGSDEPFSFILNNVIVKKIATSKDIKPAFGPTGYQTESRHREIDHRLTGFFTGEDIEAFYGTLGTNDKGEKVVKLHSLKILDKADPNYSGDGIGGEGDVNWRNCPDKEGMGCILYHRNGKEVTDSKGNKQIDRSFSILDGGFHLFVPDMHDMDNTTDEDGYDLGGPDDITSENILWARYYNADVWSWGTRVARTVPGLAEKSGDDINYILSATHYSLKDEVDKGNGYDVGFYHVNPTGAEMPVHSCYMRMSSSTSSPSKIYFAFADDFFEENHDITNQIDDASHLIDNGQLTTDHADWYNLNGQKLSGKPSANGLYIKNGKKVIIK